MDTKNLQLDNPINDISLQLGLLLGYLDKQYNINDSYIDQKVSFIQEDINKILNEILKKIIMLIL